MNYLSESNSFDPHKFIVHDSISCPAGCWPHEAHDGLTVQLRNVPKLQGAQSFVRNEVSQETLVEYKTTSWITELFEGYLQLIQDWAWSFFKGHIRWVCPEKGGMPRNCHFHREEINQWILEYITSYICIYIYIYLSLLLDKPIGGAVKVRPLIRQFVLQVRPLASRCHSPLFTACFRLGAVRVWAPQARQRMESRSF